MAGKYRGVGAAEMRWLYRVLGYDWPVCECHGVAMRWSKATDRFAGGQFKCRKAQAETEWARKKKKWANDPEWAERERQRNRDRLREKRANDPEWAFDRDFRKHSRRRARRAGYDPEELGL